MKPSTEYYCAQLNKLNILIRKHSREGVILGWTVPLHPPFYFDVALVAANMVFLYF